jgi:hypothetical protein
MNHTLKDRLLQFTTYQQQDLLAGQEKKAVELTPQLPEVIKVLELVEMERDVPSYRGGVGRHGEYRPEIVRALIAKPVLNRPTTEVLIDRLKVDISFTTLKL